MLLFFILFSLVGRLSGIREGRFSERQAFEYLKKQVAFGPRNPGSSGHMKTEKFLTRELGRWVDRLETQRFEFRDSQKSYHLTNIIGVIGPEVGSPILLGAHWDTRPWADEETDPQNRTKPILGANDGASGVAVLLEIARVLHDVRPPHPVIIVFFDGEDLGSPVKRENYFLGSKHFVREWKGSPLRFGIVVDMVCDTDLEIFIEGFSQEKAPEVVARVWGMAKRLGYTEFKERVKHHIEDDHLPFLRQGSKVIDIIDFDYPYWHTLGDTVDKCSAKSLKIVGDVLLNVVLEQ